MVCVVCRRREPAAGVVCDPDRDRITTNLTLLLRKVRELHSRLLPSPAADTTRVATSRVGSPIPARLDVLNLLGPGNVAVPAAFHPMVRRWSTTQTVTVDTAAGPVPRTVVVWHRELVRDPAGRVLEEPDDDQVGVLPPAEWAAGWVRTWRAAFGHTGPLRRYLPGPAPMLGSGGDGWVGDPVAEEWETRFGDPPDHDLGSHVHYLISWAGKACDDDVGISDCAGELRALLAELGRVLGDTPDQQWLGRCPTVLTDRASGVAAACGAGLWQDPHASQVVCPRCHSVWGPRPVELLRLAGDIRRAWPVDRRRRYSTSEVNALTLPACPGGCGGRMRVRWRDITAPADRGRWWRPEHIDCDNNCDNLREGDS